LRLSVGINVYTSSPPDRRISRCKRRRLDQYAEQPPTKFIEFDAFDVGVDRIDYVRRPDADGHYLCSRETVELMTGVPVRVLINPQTPRATAIVLLRKILEAVEAEYVGYPDGRATQSMQ
jgi:hypothetical protein